MTKLNENIQKMHDIRTSTTAVAMEFKDKVIAKQDALRDDRLLSDVGRIEKLDEYKAALGKEFIAKAAEMREAYDKAAITAGVEAESILNSEASKPSDIAVKTFERELNDFSTSLMLATNVKKAMSDVESFIDKTSEPYFAQKLKTELPTIIREISSLAGVEAPQYKAKLAKTVEALNGKALSPAQREAQQFMAGGSRYGGDIWRMDGLQVSTIEQAVGKQYVVHVNKPRNFVDITAE